MAHAKPPPVVDPDHVLLAVEAALPDTGNALTQSGEGDGTVRFAISPQDVAAVSRALGTLAGTSFWVVLVAKPKSRRKSALATDV
jgi:hypothetical protein